MLDRRRVGFHLGCGLDSSSTVHRRMFGAVDVDGGSSLGLHADRDSVAGVENARGFVQTRAWFITVSWHPGKLRGGGRRSRME